MKKLKVISDLGEFGLIKHLTDGFDSENTSVIKGIGDDAAVIKNIGNSSIITTDMLVEGIHFDLVYTPLKHLGYKSVVVNLSDVYAMNCNPSHITVSIAISNKFSLNAIEELYSGIKLACEKYGVSLIGGDTSSSVTGLMISVTAIGQSDKNNIVYRSGAKKNDLICVSGDLGGAYLGLQLLEREKEIFLIDRKIQPELKDCEYILQRQLRPEARKDIIDFFRRNKIKPNSMIDISDGLSSEIIHICEQSGTGAKVFEEKIPIHPQSIQFSEQFKLDPGIAALNGGEDYELLFTIGMDKLETLQKNSDITVIGYICDKKEGLNLVSENGVYVPLEAQGWNPLK